MGRVGKLRFDRRHVAFLAALVLFAALLVIPGANLDSARAQTLTPTLFAGSGSQSEGDSGTSTLNINVSLNCSPGTVTVNFTTADGTATAADGDYVPTSGTLTFNPGETLKTVPVTINGDTARESDESFSLILSGASGADIGTSTGTGTIFDDDRIFVSVSGPFSITEGDTGTTPANFTVALNQALQPGETVTVAFTTTDSGATDPSDYTAQSGTLTFTDTGPTSQTVAVPVVGDTASEPGEEFGLTISDPKLNGVADPGVLIGGSSQFTEIADDDTVSVSVGNASVTEGDGGTPTMTFTVSLSHVPDDVSGEDYLVDFSTVADTATESTTPGNGDYEPATGTLEWNDTQTNQSQTVVVTVNGDTAPEDDEFFDLVLSTPTTTSATNAFVIEDGSGQGTIFDDDTFRISVSSFGSEDEDTGPMNFTVSLNMVPSSTETITVDFATSDGSATAGNDYTATNETVTFTDTSPTSQTVSVPVINDAAEESTETFTVTLTNPELNGAADPSVVLETSSGTGFIFDDDAPVTPPATCGGGAGPPAAVPTTQPSPEPTPDPGPSPCPGDDANLCATPGDDAIVVDGDGVTLFAGSGADNITVLGDNVTVFAGMGDDIVLVEGDNSTVRGGSGRDTVDVNGLDADVNGGTERDDLCGGPGDDEVSGADGRDSLCGGGGNDEVSGGDKGDVIFGDSPPPQAAAAMRAYADGETLSKQQILSLEVAAAAAGGNDVLRGGLGEDLVFGARGRDFLFGGFGSDQLFGGDGNDRLAGSDGSDQIKAGAGDDRIRAGAGRNTVRAGDGIDICILNLKDEASGCETEKRRGHARRGHASFGGVLGIRSGATKPRG